MAEERVPAGWYPDPSGLPQLRWWDNHRWTEFVSDSQLEEDSAAVEETVIAEAAAEPETITVTRADARAAIEQSAETAHVPVDLGRAFDAVFGGATLAAEPVQAQPEPEVPRLAAAFDAAFGTAFDEHRTFEEPRVVDQPRTAEEPRVVEEPRIVEEPAAAQPLTPDPLETLFASSATSPVGVGTGETIGEALMRALQSA